MIIVRNGSDETVVARFQGQDFKFPAGEDTPCDEDAARHIFGYGDANKDSALLRLGWIRPGEPKDSAIARLNKIVFKQATVTIAAEEAPQKRSAA